MALVIEHIPGTHCQSLTLALPSAREETCFVVKWMFYVGGA